MENVKESGTGVRKYERELELRLADKRITRIMQEELTGFVNDCKMNKGIRTSSAYIYVRALNFFGQFLKDEGKKSFRQATKKDVEAYIASPYPRFDKEGNKTPPKSNSLLNMTKLSLKVFYKWQAGKRKRGQYPPIVDWLTLNQSKNRTEISPEDMLTNGEFLELLKACSNQKQRTFLELLFETGGRVSEILSLTVGDVHFNGAGVYVDIRQSKTVPRKVYLFDSVADLKIYTNMLGKCDLQSPLFPNDRGEYWEYEDAGSWFRRIVKKAGIQKHVHFHLLRHTRVSADCKAGMPLPLALKKYGWSKGSPMYARYSHVDDQDVGSWDAQQRGIIAKKDEDTNQIRKCKRCGELCGWTDLLCHKCGSPLEEKDAEVVEEAEKMSAYTFRELQLENAEIKKTLAAMQEKLNQLQKP